MVSARLGVNSPFNLDSKSFPSLSVAAMPPSRRAIWEAEDLADPSKSESTQLNSSSCS